MFPFGTLGVEAEVAIVGKFAGVGVDRFVAMLGYQRTVSGAEYSGLFLVVGGICIDCVV